MQLNLLKTILLSTYFIDKTFADENEDRIVFLDGRSLHHETRRIVPEYTNFRYISAYDMMDWGQPTNNQKPPYSSPQEDAVKESVYGQSPSYSSPQEDEVKESVYGQSPSYSSPQEDEVKESTYGQPPSYSSPQEDEVVKAVYGQLPSYSSPQAHAVKESVYGQPPAGCPCPGYTGQHSGQPAVDPPSQQVGTASLEEQPPLQDMAPPYGDPASGRPALGRGELHNQDQGIQDESDDCTCVPYYLCANGSVLTDGTGLLDIRVKPDTCDDYMDVCCKNPLDQKEAIKPVPTKRQGCGFRHPEGIGFRITGAVDNEAQFGELPWMLAVLKNSTKHENTLEYQCGGALIHDKVALTAAHCVKIHKPRDLIIRAGEWDTQTDNEVFPHKDAKVREIITHPQFSSGSLWNDIALVILEEALPLGENIDTVCLPKGGETPHHEECFASGWGKNQFGDEGKSQVILKKVDLPIVPDDVCEGRLRQTRLGQYFKLHKSFICAGGIPGKDTCKGDGGSPLVCPIYDRPGMYEVTGIVSWGIGCGGETPGIYADVAYERTWIDQTLSQHNIQLE